MKTTMQVETKLGSEQIITSSPMSFSGATKRIWRALSSPNTGVNVTLKVLAVVLLVPVYVVLLVWNILAWTVFGLWTLIWRHVRRGKRNEKVRAAQHAEMLAAIQAKQAEQ